MKIALRWTVFVFALSLTSQLLALTEIWNVGDERLITDRPDKPMPGVAADCSVKRMRANSEELLWSGKCYELLLKKHFDKLAIVSLSNTATPIKTDGPDCLVFSCVESKQEFFVFDASQAQVEERFHKITEFVSWSRPRSIIFPNRSNSCLLLNAGNGVTYVNIQASVCKGSKEFSVVFGDQTTSGEIGNTSIDANFYPVLIDMGHNRVHLILDDNNKVLSKSVIGSGTRFEYSDLSVARRDFVIYVSDVKWAESNEDFVRYGFGPDGVVDSKISIFHNGVSTVLADEAGLGALTISEIDEEGKFLVYERYIKNSQPEKFKIDLQASGY